MIEEFRIIAEIIGDLSKVGGWLAGAYIAYKFFVAAGMFALCWFLVKKIFEMLTAPLTYDAAQRYKRKIEDLSKEVDHFKTEAADSKRKADQYAHMYSIMKEKKNAE